MNNSKLVMEFEALVERENERASDELATKYKEREAQVIKILEAIAELKKSNAWNTLQELLFSDLASNLEKELAREAEKANPSTLQLNRITGQLTWARRYADLSALEETHKKELQGLRLHDYGSK